MRRDPGQRSRTSRAAVISYAAVVAACGAVTTVTYRRAAVTGKGVALRCGGEDILIPARVSSPAGPARAGPVEREHVPHLAATSP